MRTVLTAAAALALLAAPAALAEHHEGAIGDGYVDNTVVVTYADGSSTSWTFDADATFANSDGLSGTYTVDGSTLCMTAQTDEGPQAFCTEDYEPDAAAGDTWSTADENGGEVTVEIKEGRE